MPPFAQGDDTQTLVAAVVAAVNFEKRNKIVKTR